MIDMDHNGISKAASVLRAVRHSLRQKMIHLIDEQPGITVTDIYTALNLEQSVASQHLAILRRGNLVYTQRAGKYILYHVNYDTLNDIKEPVRVIVAVTENSTAAKKEKLFTEKNYKFKVLYLNG